ncbi:hypothetical protein M1L60_30035 [Actinoplanes sp. TRM 88003]|uniref:Uncharacterized protein n=1 Tax=Paractinoplanes aksuensis TaxID=2939490 RepID=A0ABT1DVG4_9ACTN|nr:hypothetical protein [Actinoplanes aksuensis]MCO8274844.1 hypothetical protein [Actinoplanes aksuensis]
MVAFFAAEVFLLAVVIAPALVAAVFVAVFLGAGFAAAVFLVTVFLVTVFLGAAMVAVVVAGPGSAAATERRGVTGRLAVTLAAGRDAVVDREPVVGLVAGLAAAAGLRVDAEDFVDWLAPVREIRLLSAVVAERGAFLAAAIWVFPPCE